LVILSLSLHHSRSDFDCGVEEMNRYLRENANQDSEKNLSRTFVASPDIESRTIQGFYTLAIRTVTWTHIPDARPKISDRYPIPVILLAQLAVDARFQRQQIGERLLMNAQARVDRLSRETGVFAMILDARTDNVARWYEQYDFLRRKEGPLQMYKSIRAIRKLNLPFG
jgi:hypothetical protein